MKKTILTLLVCISCAVSVSAGTFPLGYIEGTLLSGLLPGKAPTMLRLQGKYIGPGEYEKTDFDGCILIAESNKEIGQERFSVRPMELSCVDAQNIMIKSASVRGFLAGSDGMIGLPDGNPGTRATIVLTDISEWTTRNGKSVQKEGE